MARTKKDLELDDRARDLIEDQLGGRGKFTLLESISGIGMSQWKNFFYGKQSLNDQMLAFLRKQYPHDEQWLLTGTPSPDQSSFPFLAPVPKANECMTIGSRMNWVIREITSLGGDGLFKYLSSKRGVSDYFSSKEGVATTHSIITPEEWKEAVLGIKEPSSAMIAFVCQMRPHFASWVLLGRAVSNQVDPTNPESIAEWKKANPPLLPVTKLKLNGNKEK